MGIPLHLSGAAQGGGDALPHCWLRDATITLEALLRTGYTEEAFAWRAWLQRAVAGQPRDVQIMYGVAGERRLPQWEAEWLPGDEGSVPARIGNAAVDQFQLDVYGEVVDALTLDRRVGMGIDQHVWSLQRIRKPSPAGRGHR